MNHAPLRHTILQEYQISSSESSHTEVFPLMHKAAFGTIFDKEYRNFRRQALSVLNSVLEEENIHMHGCKILHVMTYKYVKQ